MGRKKLVKTALGRLATKTTKVKTTKVKAKKTTKVKTTVFTTADLLTNLKSIQQLQTQLLNANVANTTAVQALVRVQSDLIKLGFKKPTKSVLSA